MTITTLLKALCYVGLFLSVIGKDRGLAVVYMIIWLILHTLIDALDKNR